MVNTLHFFIKFFMYQNSSNFHVYIYFMHVFVVIILCTLNKHQFEVADFTSLNITVIKSDDYFVCKPNYVLCLFNMSTRIINSFCKQTKVEICKHCKTLLGKLFSHTKHTKVLYMRHILVFKKCI